MKMSITDLLDWLNNNREHSYTALQEVLRTRLNPDTLLTFHRAWEMAEYEQARGKPSAVFIVPENGRHHFRALELPTTVGSACAEFARNLCGAVMVRKTTSI
jgi:hypothetical protein